MLDVSLYLQELGVDRFSLWLLACVDKTATLRVAALFDAFLLLKRLLSLLQVAQHNVKHLFYLRWPILVVGACVHRDQGQIVNG